MSEDFPSFAKIPRLYKPVVITEKIDGTNALIEVVEVGTYKLYDISWGSVGEFLRVRYEGDFTYVRSGEQAFRIRAGSRKRWIGAASGDNFGFAAWVSEHAEELVGLGPGLHYGEWFGKGIQRGYGLDERQFALFNVARWREAADAAGDSDICKVAPACCRVVPILSYVPSAENIELRINNARESLLGSGSWMVGGWMKPEGIVLYFESAKQYFKVLFEGNNQPKGMRL